MGIEDKWYATALKQNTAASKSETAFIVEEKRRNISQKKLASARKNMRLKEAAARDRAVNKRFKKAGRRKLKITLPVIS